MSAANELARKNGLDEQLPMIDALISQILQKSKVAQQKEAELAEAQKKLAEDQKLNNYDAILEDCEHVIFLPACSHAVKSIGLKLKRSER